MSETGVQELSIRLQAKI